MVDKKNNKARLLNFYLIIIFMLAFIGGFIVVKSATIMYLESSYWLEIEKQFRNDSVPIKSIRGNIFSADGKLLASSIPEYELRMDLNSNNKQKEKLTANLNEISKGLHKIFPDRSANYFANQIKSGIRSKSRNKLIYPYRVNYIDLQAVKELPVLREHKYVSGLIPLEFNYRKKPFESLASRTIGDLYPDITKGAKNGLELYFDTELKGVNGKGHRQKVRNQYISITDTPPINGSDLITTIDIDMQDIAEKALTSVLKENGATTGIAILMEASTGDLKAIVNLTKTSGGYYTEVKNHAFADLYEQGSTVKTASILIALDDKKVTPNNTVDLGNGMYKLYDRFIKDYNYRSGGFKDNKIKDIREIMMFSSNIGVGRTIEENYRNNKQAFVSRFQELLGPELDVPIPGAATPIIKNADNKYFSNTTLAWMSFGYETLIPPINVVTFYNAIANNGKMMAPRLVQSINKDGAVLKRFPPKVINDEIASEAAIKDIKKILELVVSDGLGKRAGSTEFKVAGKTGTAQMSIGGNGYKGGKHLLSFCGYFPADNPKYTCLVSIVTNNGGGGGKESAIAFKEIAERIYAMKVKDSNTLIASEEEKHKILPHVEKGLYGSTKTVFKELDFDYEAKVELGDKNTLVETKNNNSKIELKEIAMHKDIVPSVYGLGAKDAVYVLESIGIEVQLSGKGKVYHQSIPAGHKFTHGTKIKLDLK